MYLSLKQNIDELMAYLAYLTTVKIGYSSENSPLKKCMYWLNDSKFNRQKKEERTLRCELSPLETYLLDSNSCFHWISFCLSSSEPNPSVPGIMLLHLLKQNKTLQQFWSSQAVYASKAQSDPSDAGTPHEIQEVGPVAWLSRTLKFLNPAVLKANVHREYPRSPAHCRSHIHGKGEREGQKKLRVCYPWNFQVQ